MTSLIFLLAAVAFCLSLLLTPVLRNLCRRFGIMVDMPDQNRKLHSVAVPRCGGVAIVIASFAALAVAYLLMPAGSSLYVRHHAVFAAVLPGTMLVFLVGLADDLWDLRPKHKLLGQFIASLVAVSLGARLDLHHLPAWLSFVASVIWLLACTNAMNLIDGLDGLATGAGLVATLTTLTVALLTGNTGLVCITAPLAGALLAFLFFNFTPASVFLGDSGSLSIGFVLGCLGLVWSRPLGALGMLGPLFALALPLADASHSIVRRFLRGTRIFQGDRGHIHHRVLDMGLSTRRTALVLYCCCVLFAAMAVLQSEYHRWPLLLSFVLCVAVGWLGVRQLQLTELQVVRRVLTQRSFRRSVRQKIYLEDLRRGLQSATTPDECWRFVQRACDELAIGNVQIKLGDRRFSSYQLPVHAAPDSTLHLPLGEESWVVFMGPVDIAPSALLAALEPIRARSVMAPRVEEQKIRVHTAA